MLPIRNNTILLYTIFSVLIVLMACSKKETAVLPDFKREYFFLKLGHTLTYQMDSTYYDEYTKIKSNYSFQLKDSVVAEIASQTGTSFYIERYKKEANKPWVFQKIISRTITSNRAEEFIDNQRFVKLVFPPEKQKTWNGNTFNSLGTQEYYYQTLDKAETVNNVKYDSTALVIQINEKNLLTDDYSEELYAKNIGLIKKSARALHRSNFNTDYFGSSYTMQIISAK